MRGRPGPPGRPEHAPHHEPHRQEPHGHEPHRHEPHHHEAHRPGAARPAPGHGHSHAPGRLLAGWPTEKIVRWVLIPLALATALGVVLMWPGRAQVPAQSPNGAAYVRAWGEVLAMTVETCPPTADLLGPPMPCGTAVVAVTDGPGAGQSVYVDLPQGPGAPYLAVGDKVVLSYLPATGDIPARYFVVDHQRGRQLLTILGLVAVAIVVFGRWRGLTAIVGLGVSFAVLLLFIIPAILNGAPPLLVAIVGSAAVMFAVLYLTHGFSTHTSVAVLGTLASLALTGLLGWAFTASAALTGFTSDESLYVSLLNSEVDMRGLLLAGIIIGALGVLDDVTVTQATTVAELAPGAASRRDLFRSAIRIGRAHVASAVNTIVLAYAGTALPLLLLISAGGQPISDLLTSQVLATEIVRAAVGTLGLVAAVPITTALATLVADIRHRPEHHAVAPPADHARAGHPDPELPRQVRHDRQDVRA